MRRRYWWWILLGIVLLAVGIWWWRRPAEMHVCASIAGECNHEDARWTPLGLCRWSWPAQPEGASTVTLYGWDGKPRWTVHGPAGICNYGWRELELGCSPDGHVVAITILEMGRVRVMSWRDGRPLGDCYVTLESGIYTVSVDVLLRVTNSGRLWLYHTFMPYCPIIAVDGVHVAFGRLSMPRPKSDPPVYDWELSSDGTTMAVRQDEANPVVRFCTLAVQGEHVTVAHTRVCRDATFFSVSNGGLTWDLTGRLHDASGTILNQTGWSSNLLSGTDGTVLELTPKKDRTLDPHAAVACRFHHLVSGRQWEIRSSRPRVTALCGTPDGKYVLTAEQGLPHTLRSLPASISAWPAVARFIQDQRRCAQLVVYAGSGQPCAFYPIMPSKGRNGEYVCLINGTRYELYDEYAISPDGRQVGLRGYQQQDNEKVGYVIIGR